MKKNYNKFLALASIAPVFLALEGVGVAAYNSLQVVTLQQEIGNSISQIVHSDTLSDLDEKLAQYQKIYDSKPSALSFISTDDKGENHYHLIPVKATQSMATDFPSAEEVKKRIDNMKNSQIVVRPKIG